VFPAGVASALPGFYFGHGAIVRPRRSFSTPATLYQTVPPPRRAVGLLLNRGTFAPSSQLRSVSRLGDGDRKSGIVVSKSWSIVANLAVGFSLGAIVLFCCLFTNGGSRLEKSAVLTFFGDAKLPWAECKTTLDYHGRWENGQKKGPNAMQNYVQPGAKSQIGVETRCKTTLCNEPAFFLSFRLPNPLPQLSRENFLCDLLSLPFRV
jgi:hypothetical protein